MPIEKSPYAYIAASFHQVAWVVKDVRAAEKFFTEKMGIPRFFHVEGMSAEATQGFYRGEPGNFIMHLYLAYAAETQIELIEHVAGRSIFKEFLDKRGEGVHHVGYLVPDYEKAAADLTANGFSVIQGLRPPGARVGYFDTEAAIGVITEIFSLDADGRRFFDQVKHGDF